jgi:hypothetical protein
MDLKTASDTRSVDLRCPRCRAMTVRYWPDYDRPGDVLACPACAGLYELRDARHRRLAPFDADGNRRKAWPQARTR